MDRILLVDDDRDLSALLARSAAEENLAADCCASGREALALLEQGDYQLVVLDVMMPGMDGFETMARIRAKSGVPILMLTARGDAESKVRGLRAGADDYLTKPFAMEELLARMPTERILVPEPLSREPVLLQAAEASGAAVEVVDQRRELELGEAALTVFPPLEGEPDANDAGLVILAAAGEREMLITGDLSAGAEARLLETWELPDIEVLAAGHHGAADATSAELLDALAPEIVCISVGENNRYGHPAAETLRRLGARDCAVYRTDLHGDIHLSWNRGDTDGIRKESAGEK